MNTNWLCWSVSVVCLTAIDLRAQPTRPDAPGQTPARLTERRLQRPLQAAPWNRDLALLRSTDGLNFSEQKPFVERAAVPCLTEDAQGRLVAVFQWFPFDQPQAFDRVAMCFSEDGGRTWTAPRKVEFSNWAAEYERPFDPTIVTLPDGRFRLYFTSRAVGEQTAIYSATSADGLLYTFEPGPRFAVEGENVVDCSVAKFGEAWHLFAPAPRQPGEGYHAVSKDGLNFERKADVAVSGDGTWIGNVLTVDGQLKFYGSGPNGVWSARSDDGATWKEDPGSRVPGGDPAVWRVKGGHSVMVVTTNLRADAPMNPPWRREGPMWAGPEAGGNPGALPPGGAFAQPFSEGASITANERYVYVFKDRTVYQFDAQTLQLLHQTPLPEPAGRSLRPRGPRTNEPRTPRPAEP